MVSGASIVVMAKLPLSGVPKRRLAPMLSLEERRTLQAALLEDALDRALQVAECYLAFSPPDAATEAATYSRVESFPDVGSDLGERMASAAERVLKSGHDAVLVVGTDCPYLASTDLAEAVLQLREADVSLGPALDGGYYLIGLRRPNRALFAGIPWSSPSTLAATLKRITELGLTYRTTRLLPDIDTPADFVALAENITAGGPWTVHSPRVQALVRSWRQHPGRAAPDEVFDPR